MKHRHTTIDISAKATADKANHKIAGDLMTSGLGSSSLGLVGAIVVDVLLFIHLEFRHFISDLDSAP